jgi:hypothetical protein
MLRTPASKSGQLTGRDNRKGEPSMRTLTAIALAITMLAGVTVAHATTHKKHHKKHQASSESKSAKASKEKAPAAK